MNDEITMCFTWITHGECDLPHGTLSYLDLRFILNLTLFWADPSTINKCASLLYIHIMKYNVMVPNPLVYSYYEI